MPLRSWSCQSQRHRLAQSELTDPEACPCAARAVQPQSHALLQDAHGIPKPCPCAPKFPGLLLSQAPVHGIPCGQDLFIIHIGSAHGLRQDHLQQLHGPPVPPAQAPVHASLWWARTPVPAQLLAHWTAPPGPTAGGRWAAAWPRQTRRLHSGSARQLPVGAAGAGSVHVWGVLEQ